MADMKEMILVEIVGKVNCTIRVVKIKELLPICRDYVSVYHVV